MENRAYALAAGSFALLLGLAVIAAIYWFGGKEGVTAQYLIVSAQNVSGLNPQAQVRYRGIRVGKVLDIALDDRDARKILVRIEVDKKVPITKGTVAKIGQQGVTGIAHILLEESSDEMKPIEAGSDGGLPRIAMVPSLLDEVGESGSEVLEQAKIFFTKANHLFDDKTRANIAGTLSNLEKGTARLNQILADDRLQRLGSAVAKVDDAAGDAKAFFHDARELIPKMHALSGRLEVLIGEHSGEGATATVARLNELSQELTATTQQLNRVLQVVEQSPESLLFGAPPRSPGPGEPGFVAPSVRGSKKP